jgi:hypothetical protein
MKTCDLLAALALASCGSSSDSARAMADGGADVGDASVGTVLGGDICAVRGIVQLCSATFADTANAGVTCDFVRASCGGYSVWSERLIDEVDGCVYDLASGQIVDAVICGGADQLCSGSMNCGGGSLAPTLPAACAIPPDTPGCQNIRPVHP